MGVLIAVFLFLLGVFLTIKGADLFIDAAKWMSGITGMSKAVIGATVVAFSTNIPELCISAIAISQGSVGLSIANVVGTNIFNIGVAFSVIAIARPGESNDRLTKTRSAVLILTTIMLFLFCITGVVSIINGVALLLIFAFYVRANIKRGGDAIIEERAKPTRRDFFRNIMLFFVGLGFVVAGSFFLVDNAKIIARALGISEFVIGLTIVAIGTSLTEVVVSIIAIRKKENEMAIGNIIGSNIFNVGVIMAVVAFMSGGFVIDSITTMFDLPLLLAMTLVITIPLIFKKKIYRWQGFLLVLLYVGYSVALMFLH